MRILVCGGREYGFDDPVGKSNFVRMMLLKVLHWGRGQELPMDVTIIHGDATGADTLGGLAAQWFGWKCEVYPADWEKHGKAAGPIRNKQMLDEGKPDLVVAFPGGKGTANMVKQAREAGVEVYEVSAS